MKASAIGRAKNLEKLQKEIKELETKIATIKEKLDSKQKELALLKAATHRTQLEQLQKDFNQVNEEYISVKTRKEQLAQMLSSNTTRREDITGSIEKISNSLEQLRPEIGEAEQGFSTKEEEIEKLETEAKAQSQLLTEKSQAYNEKKHPLPPKTKQGQLGRAGKLAIKKVPLRAARLVLPEIRASWKKMRRRSKNSSPIPRTMKASSSACTMRRRASKKGLTRLKKTIMPSGGDIDVADKTLRELQRKREQADVLLMELQNRLNETKLELSAVKERLSVEFAIDLDQLLKEAVELDVEIIGNRTSGTSFQNADAAGKNGANQPHGHGSLRRDQRAARFHH